MFAVFRYCKFLCWGVLFLTLVKHLENVWDDIKCKLEEPSEKKQELICRKLSTPPNKFSILSFAKEIRENQQYDKSNTNEYVCVSVHASQCV